MALFTPPSVDTVGTGIAVAGIVVMPWTVVGLAHCAIWPVTGVPEYDIFPAPDGVDHVPSPRQYVDEDAEVPLAICVVAIFPDRLANDG